MKKTLLLVLTLVLCLTTQAQVNTITATGANGEEEVIDLPESMTTGVDSLLNLYNSRTYLKTDDDCNMPDTNPTYDTEVYIERLAQLPNIIEMPYNDIVQKFIDRYTGDLRRKVAYWVGAQNFYMPIFEEALEARQLPLELKYLPVIESGLDPMATSRAGAAGLWQFMITTAKRYGLEVNSLVDERRDPYKASVAAANYLGDLYDLFQDWTLVIAAYNCGEEKVNKAIHRAGGEKDYWKIYPYLPHETRGYVPAFIAANYVMNYYCDHNICPLQTTLPDKSDTVIVNRDLHFEQVAHVTGVTLEQLQVLNPQYRHSIINGTTQPSTLCLPNDLVNVFIDNEDSAYVYQEAQLLTRRRIVTPNGQTTYNVQGNQVTSRQSNARRQNKKSRYSKSRKKSKKQSAKRVTVRKGDTLSDIAKRNHTTVAKLKKLNGISGTTIQAGKKIKVK